MPRGRENPIEPPIDWDSINFDGIPLRSTLSDDFSRLAIASPPLIRQIDTVRSNIVGSGNQLPRNLAEMSREGVCAFLDTAIAEKKKVFFWGTIVRSQFLNPVVRYEQLDNERLRIFGLDGGQWTIIEDCILYANNAEESETMRHAVERASYRDGNDSQYQLDRIFRDVRAQMQDNCAARLVSNAQDVYVRRIHDAERLPNCIRITVSLGSSENHTRYTGYLSDASYVEWADSDDVPRRGRAEQERLLFQVMQRIPIDPITNTEMQSISNFAELVNYAHRQRHNLQIIRKTGGEVYLFSIGPYVGNGFFATESGEGGTVRFTEDMFVKMRDGGSSSRRAMNALTLDNIFSLSMEQHREVILTMGSYLRDGFPRQFTISNISKVIEAYGEDVRIVMANIKEDGKQTAISTAQVEYAVLSDAVETVIPMTNEEHIASLTEEIATLKDIIAELRSEDYQINEIERRRGLAAELMLIYKDLYGEDSIEYVTTLAQYNWLTQKFDTLVAAS